MGDVVYLDGQTCLDIPADRVLEAAVGVLDSVVLVGYDKEGNEYVASSTSKLPDVLWMLERAKKMILEHGEED